jgi:hypothetical protein
MRYLGYVAGVILFSCMFISCAKKSTAPTSGPIYFSSFESPEEATGWHGITEDMFVDHPAPNGGIRSLYIGGGCIQPAAYNDLPSQTTGGSYTISCWGKLQKSPQEGNVLLTVANGGAKSKQVQLTIVDEEWRFYESEESLHCPANCQLRLEIFIGGFCSAYMFIDCIKIEKTKE